MFRKYYISSLKGLFIGATMLIPGISGGSMAMILGIYDRLISSISSFRKNPLDHLLFLTLFSVSAGIGMLLFSTPLTWLLEHYPMASKYFFLGAVFGGIPLIEKKSRIQRLSLDVLFYLLIGFIFVVIFTLIPSGIFQSFATDHGFSLMILPLIGAVASAALILPGISVSHFLLILGVYDSLLNAISNMDFTFLCPLGIGILLGIILFSKLLEYLMKRHPKQTYLIILGFILGSALQIFPGIPSHQNLLVCTVLAVMGFFAVYQISKKEN